MSSIDVSVNVTNASFNSPYGIAFDNSVNYFKTQSYYTFVKINNYL